MGAVEDRYKRSQKKSKTQKIIINRQNDYFILYRLNIYNMVPTKGQNAVRNN